jgi:hypothetical protein
MEEWLPIVTFERYEISNLGNIRRGSRMLKPGLDTYGYNQINLYKDGKRFTKKIYRLVLETFNPNVCNKPQIDHINRIRSDDRLENLRWVTASENVRNSKNFTEDMLGISWNKKNSKYIVRLSIHGQRECYFGSCETLSQAKLLRDSALKNEICFTKQRNRETYGICLLKTGKYQVRVNNSTVGYRNTFEEAKILRDSFNRSV